MMKNLTQQIKTALLLSVFVFLAITVKAQNNYFIKMDGTKVNIHGEELYDDGKTISYKNEDNKRKIESIKNIKIMFVGGSVLINIPINPKRDFRSLQYIVAFNDKYVLTGKSYTLSDNLNVLDREFNFVNTDEIKLFHGAQNKVREKNKQIYKENALKYFKDCANVNEAIYKNIENDMIFYNGINYYNCNNALDLFTNKEVKSSEVNVDKELKNIDFYENTQGEKIELKNCGLIELSNNFKYYSGSKTSTVPSSEIKYIWLENKIYTPITINGKKHIIEVVGFNNKHVLFVKYFEKRISLGVYDRVNNIVSDEIKISENINPIIDKYFADCSDLKKMINENVKNHRTSTFGIIYLNCNNSKEFIEGIELE